VKFGPGRVGATLNLMKIKRNLDVVLYCRRGCSGGGERAVAGMPSRQREGVPRRENADNVHASGEGRGRVDEGDRLEKGQDHEGVANLMLQAVPCVASVSPHRRRKPPTPPRAGAQEYMCRSGPVQLRLAWHGP